MRLIRIAAVFLFAAAFCASAAADGPKYDVIDKQKVYYGDCSSFSKPSTIAIDEVFPHIRSFKLIDERNLNESDPEYWVLLLRANEKFRAALKSIAAVHGLDLIAERGAIKSLGDESLLPDITNLIVAEVSRNPEEQSDE